MSPLQVLSFVAAYFLLLIVISFFTAKKGDNQTFFVANRNSPWFVVAFGMIGASLSGITFISVPGWVADSQFSYMQMVLGYVLGYIVIAHILLPLYYRLNLTSIYTYLDHRFGNASYKTGAFFFLLSRVIGASFRLFLVATVLQLAVFNEWEVPFWVTVVITIMLIWIYTFKGGIKTIVWTDTLQTLFMLAAVGFTIYTISQDLNLSVAGLTNAIDDSPFSQIFFWDWQSSKNFFKSFFAGTFITIVMTGLDQDMMQKNLTCRNIRDAQKNVYSLGITLVFVNFFFLCLGALLYMYANQSGIAIPEKTDLLFPTLALNHFAPIVGAAFILGLIAAAYSSADSALTALTTSFCIDFLGFQKHAIAEDKKVKTRYAVHVGFSILLMIVILIFHAINNEAVISALFTVAGYTYGPLLGLFSFGLFTHKLVKDKYVPIICVAAPVLSGVLNFYSEEIFFGYKFGFELLIVNGLLTFIGLWLISSKGKKLKDVNTVIN